MLYEILREVARVALHWYYRDILVQGAERIPRRGPVLVVANHPNALVDALLIGTSIPRRVLLTAKATLFDQPLLARLLEAVGVVPLRRAKDVSTSGVASTPARNAEAFRRVTDALVHDQVVLVFPEGISHDEPMLAPLRTGAARMVMAADEAGVRGLRVLPVGLVFEAKERPRSRVLVRIGEPLDIDTWRKANAYDAASLTQDIEVRLRTVTLNFASAVRAERSVRFAGALSAIAHEPESVGESISFSSEADVAGRVEAATDALEHAPVLLVAAADSFISRLTDFEKQLATEGINLTEAKVSPHVRHGVQFVVREGLLVLIALPIALFGWVTHWLPVRLARSLARRSLGSDRSRDQPAMRTIVFGAFAVIVWYIVQAAIMTHWFGARMAVLWIVALFLAARIDLLLGDRVSRAFRRAQTYLALRKNAELRASVPRELDAFVQQALELERALQASASDGVHS